MACVLCVNLLVPLDLCRPNFHCTVPMVHGCCAHSTQWLGGRQHPDPNGRFGPSVTHIHCESLT